MSKVNAKQLFDGEIANRQGLMVNKNGFTAKFNKWVWLKRFINDDVGFWCVCVLCCCELNPVLHTACDLEI